MDDISLKILNLLNTHSKLNWYQFNVLIPLLNLEKFSQSMGFLYNEKLVKKSRPFDSKDEEDFNFTFDTSFEIALAGKQFLASRKEDNKKFKIQSVYVPIAISFITALITTLTTLWLSK